MKNIFIFLFSFSSFLVFSQKITSNKDAKKSPEFSFSRNILIEDSEGNLVLDSLKREAYFLKKQREYDLNSNKSALTQIAVPLCTNGGFEEFETISGENVLTNFQYGIGSPLNPMQCKTIDADNYQNIVQYNPANFGLMATTVPSNFIDEYIGNINAFDQYNLKINFKESSTSSSVVQARRFKTNNETSVKFNYKAVLQSITENDHDNEQPYFKARILNVNGVQISEFCLIADPKNCIFTQAPNLEAGSIVLYNPNWQSGILDISSLPNNEEFTIEFMASRCGLGGHFGYVYIDDICLLHSNENLQGSIELDPLYKICPTLPISVCGSYTLPNSGGISATVSSITLQVFSSTNAVIYTSIVPATLDIVTHRFCFSLTAANLVNVTTGNYNVGVTINYGITQTNCAGTSFNMATDSDANPGWDISFMNCTPTCNFTLQTANLTLCDTNKNGKEFFNLNNLNTLIAGTQTGLTFSYFPTLNDATSNTNPLAGFTNFESPSAIVYIRVSLNPTCFKVIAAQLIVKNPYASISGILNICSGSTLLTSSPGVSYLWSNGSTTQSITATAIGIYTVSVTDANGCISIGTVNINTSQVAVLPSIQVIQPSCSVATGTITITSPASEYSFDDGNTWTTNATMSNVAVGNYLIKIKTATGCLSYSSNIAVIPFLSSFPDFSSVEPTSCGDLGSITITSVASSYSFDDGVTWTLNNVATNLPSGTYLIRTKDAFGCLSNSNSVNLNSEFLPIPQYTVIDPYCGVLGSITITTPAAEYSFDGGTTWQTSNTLNNLDIGSYVIKIKNAQGCTSPISYVYLNYFESNYPAYILTDAGCGIYASITITTQGDLYSFDGGVTWPINPIALNLTSGAYYNLIVKRGNCITLTASVYIYSSFLPIPAANDYQTLECDNLNDGSENLNLSNYNTNLIANSTSYSFTYFSTLLGAENNISTDQINNSTAYNITNNGNYEIYVRVTSTDNCFKVVKLELALIPSPIIDMQNAYPLCEKSNVRIDAGPGFSSYLWSTGEITQTVLLTQPGDYLVTVTEDHNPLICSTTKNFNVFLSNPATISQIITADWADNDNTITVLLSDLSIGNYEYSIDGVNYQDSNVFTGLDSGVYTVTVRDKNGCGSVKDDVYLLVYPKFFTPNGDGFNDSWSVKYSRFEPGLKVELFDRYGKFIKEMHYNETWDGRYNGAELPSTDYWFVVSRADGKQFKGHFTLKR